jgi:4a-hydroxytetrahydrobiopterin dehydratase
MDVDTLEHRRDAMGKPEKLSQNAVDTFVTAHAGWKHEGDALVKTYTFKHYGGTIAFVVHVAFAAEKRDHHPDLHVSWGKVEVRWTTHDAGGITELDAAMAEVTDHVYQR